MVSNSFALALTSPFLPLFRARGVPQRGHLHLLAMFFSLLLCTSQYLSWCSFFFSQAQSNNASHYKNSAHKLINRRCQSQNGKRENRSQERLHSSYGGGFGHFKDFQSLKKQDKTQHDTRNRTQKRVHKRYRRKSRLQPACQNRKGKKKHEHEHGVSASQSYGVHVLHVGF